MKVSYLSWSEFGHLAARTFRSLRKPQVDTETQMWLFSYMSAREKLLFRSMPLSERAHGLDCALRIRAIDGCDSPDVIVAAALHDVGKTSSALSTPGRIVASLLSLCFGQRLQGWATLEGLRAQIGRYLNHAEIGAEMLEEAGSKSFVVLWARCHHWPEDEIDLDIDMVSDICDVTPTELIKALKSVDY